MEIALNVFKLQYEFSCYKVVIVSSQFQRGIKKPKHSFVGMQTARNNIKQTENVTNENFM